MMTSLGVLSRLHHPINPHKRQVSKYLPIVDAILSPVFPDVYLFPIGLRTRSLGTFILAKHATSSAIYSKKKKNVITRGFPAVRRRTAPEMDPSGHLAGTPDGAVGRRTIFPGIFFNVEKFPRSGT